MKLNNKARFEIDQTFIIILVVIGLVIAVLLIIFLITPWREQSGTVINAMGQSMGWG
ncbi:MAG: hypothetical protein GOU97_00915 [Nanoarchaeota archaeon]|nr:hypothetical protein [Nanoarchaeota archaeon]